MRNLAIPAQSRKRVMAKLEKRTVRAFSGFVKAVFLIGFCFAVVYPLMTILSKSVMGRMDLFDNTVILIPKTFTLQNYQIAAMLMNYGEALKNSALLSAMVMLLETASCLLVAYGMARFQFKLRGLFLALVVFTLIVPPQLIMVPMYVQFSGYDPLGLCTLLFGGSLNLIDSFLPFGLLAATAVGVKNGLFILIFFQFFRNMPRELEEAALIDGAGAFGTFTRVMLPNARTSMVTVMLFGFLWQYNDMNYTTAFLKSTPVFSNVYMNLDRFTLEVYDILGTTQYDMTVTLYAPLVKSAGILMIMGPLLLVFLFCQRFFVESIERVGIVG